MLSTVTATGYEVEVRHDVRVPMPDGIDLLGNLYVPIGEGSPTVAPGILTMIPYHKDGRGGLGMLDGYHRHFASRGYVVLHLDLRGTGSSEGEIMRTLDGRERLDGHHVVEWMAEQEWCTGSIGVWGISYGGITSMAIAETIPPHLRAIVPIHAPSDNYESMIEHQGSRLMFWPDPHWGGGMAASNLMPPLRSSDGDAWLRIWQERLEADPWLLDWYGETADPDHWIRQRVDISRITVPSLVICGWQDAYPDSVSEFWDRLGGPKRLLFGPWKHVMPESSVREPVDTLALIDRWWDRWLREEKNGVDEEPPVTIFVQGAEVWRQEESWPPARAEEQTFYLGAEGSLSEEPGKAGWQEYQFDARAGLCAVPYDACTGPVLYPEDQSFDDYLSSTFTAEPVEEPFELTGSPSVRLVFSVEEPLEDINLVAKLCDVDSTGRSFLITFEHISGRLAQVDESAEGRSTYVAEFALRPTSYVIRAGHRLRLSVSGSNFPYLWPTPFQYRMHFWCDRPSGSCLRLPLVGPQLSPLPDPDLGPPPVLTPAGRLGNSERYWTHRENTSRAVTFEGRRENIVAVEPGVRLTVLQHFAMSVDADHPAQASTRTNAEWRLERTSASVQTRVQTVTTLNDVSIHAEIDLDGVPYFRKHWRRTRAKGGERRALT
jgi:uncharacterized protein